MKKLECSAALTGLKKRRYVMKKLECSAALTGLKNGRGKDDNV